MGVQVTETYVHTETPAANVWTIVHNLGTETPIVDVWVDAGQTGVDATYDERWDSLYSVAVTDENTVVVTLENPGGSPNNYTGRAFVV